MRKLVSWTAALIVPLMLVSSPLVGADKDKNKEITVVLATRFESLEVRPDLMTADQELAERLHADLQARACGVGLRRIKSRVGEKSTSRSTKPFGCMTGCC